MRRGTGITHQASRGRGGSVLEKWQTLLALVALGLALGFAAGFHAGQRDALGDCPSEDSCAVDYDADGWHVVELRACPDYSRDSWVARDGGDCEPG